MRDPSRNATTRRGRKRTAKCRAGGVCGYEVVGPLVARRGGAGDVRTGSEQATGPVARPEAGLATRAKGGAGGTAKGRIGIRRAAQFLIFLRYP